ncbi:MAG TPA: class I adenylate-forming enzyme family protein [Candidatus Baltobacteraceae bacterium]|jgi:acyl-CoA synthetase (AMP-forming)/AMP-acid ligase II
MNRAAGVSPLSGVRYWARLDPSREAIVDGGVRLTYADLLARVDATAAYFQSRGARRGSIIGMSLRNTLDALVIPLAAAALGAQISPVNFRLKARELGNIAAHLNATVFVYGDDLADEMQRANLNTKPAFVAHADFEVELQAFEGKRAGDGFATPADAFTLMWTSGTRGLPKPCRGSLAARMNWIATFPFVYGVRPHDNYLAVMPVVHSAGMTFALAYLNFGGTVFLCAHFDACETWRLIREEKIDAGMFVPSMLQMLIEEDPSPETPVPETFRTMITAGSRIRPALHAQVLERFPNRLFTYYGSTESPSMTVLRPHEQAAYPESVGRPYFGVELQVRNPRMLPDYPVRVGDIVARNPYAMDSYAVEGVPIPVSRDGWIETGDIGYFNEDGLLHVFGRAADVIISGGLNISLPEVERVIAAHPLVKEVAVVGIEDERWGELPAAAIVPIDARDANRIIEAIDAHCRSELAGYKRPRHIITLAELPRTASGKASVSEIRTLIAVRVQA